MRNKWLALMIFGLQAIAAGKSRDWQTGQIVDSGANQNANARVHTVASKDKTYIARGSMGDADQAPAAGASIRFAIEGKTMFVSIAGKEYRLYLLGERVATPGVADSPRPAAVQSSEALDNDAVVKMIVGGLKEETIVRVIEARPGKYTLTADAVTGLKAAGVPQSVIAAMSAQMGVPKIGVPK
jgi:hypothetical protein